MNTDIRTRTLVIAVLVCCFCQPDLYAQKPVLKHSYTFEDGTARDVTGNADGVMKGGKIEDGKYFSNELGAYIELPARAIKINKYKALSLEAFVVAGTENEENTMVSYFGNEVGLLGTDYIFQALKNQGFSCSAISCKSDSTPWGTENRTICNPLDDGLPHYIVTTFDNKELRFYMDGLLVNVQTNDNVPDNLIENIGDSVAYLAKSGYSWDPTWHGAIDAFNIYEGILDAETIEKSAQDYLPEQVLAVRNKLTSFFSADSLTTLSRYTKIDSLQSLINNNKSNEEKVRWLNEQARLNFYNHAFEKAFDATIEARDLAKQINFEGGEVLYHYTLATLFGQWTDMYNYHIQKARLMANSESFDVPPPNFSMTYDPIQINKLESLSKKYEALGEKEIQANLVGLIAIAYYIGNRHAELINTDFRALALFKELGDPYPVLLFYSVLNSDVRDENTKEKIRTEMQEYLKQLKKENAIGPLNFQMANVYRATGQPELALKYYLKSIKYFEEINDSTLLVNVYWEMGQLYDLLGMYAKQVEMNDKRIELLTQLKRYREANNAKAYAIWALRSTKQYDKARMYINSLLQDSTDRSYPLRIAQKNDLEGLIAIDNDDYTEAIPRFNKALSLYVPLQIYGSIQWNYKHLALCYYNLGEYETALQYANKSLDYAKYINLGDVYDKEISVTTSEIYDALGDKSKAYEYLKRYQKAVDRIENTESNQGIFETLVSSALEKTQEEIDQLEQERALKEQQNKTQRLWIFSITGALLSALLLAFILYRNNKHKQKANALLHKQKKEIETTYEQLKATQSQLVQSEKMASLGELTAGIAHEIQNPLNFVNNFSELSSELIDEMNEELEREDIDEAKVIAGNIKQNLDKINHHGKRAESIVKGMLLHSRGSSGQKEPTDINALADEYLRLSYHGFRAKDKSFNADFNLEADESLPKVNVVTQDIGRVLLNLINNAFYAVSEKAKQNIEGYKPIVVVSTKMLGNKVEVRVQDNGHGIPKSVKDKIFQPFFSTKPTGQGTGLGLSMSYDIVKAHGGTLMLNSLENEGSEFVIQLPFS